MKERKGGRGCERDGRRWRGEGRDREGGRELGGRGKDAGKEERTNGVGGGEGNRRFFA